MAFSRSARITLLLVIDVLFFFVELIVGYVVGSLALVADSFHMLNDVMSLVVALYAIKLTEQETPDSRYSYGWHRAEILAALVNGVFLLALCFSIFLEALERFFSTPEISNPRLVVIVGSFGLASNIVGLFLFHEHGHEHDHSHPSPSPLSSTPQTISHASLSSDSTPTQKQSHPVACRPTSRSRSVSRSRADSYAAMYGHPAATRASLMQTAQEMAHARSPSPSNLRHSGDSLPRASLDRPRTGTYDVYPSLPLTVMDDEDASPREQDPLLPNRHDGEQNGFVTPATEDVYHSHTQSHGYGKVTGGHSHNSMNMRALLLHVLGDALGNVGVIATGLVIWLSSWSFKYYFDPVISLAITAIIFSSAMPLVRSASFILLQGVPPQISLDDVRNSILDVDGVLSLHELHVWQLSESKIIASVHVLTSRTHDFMPVASKIREALHHHGIHSSTIQPEYLGSHTTEETVKPSSDSACLILCPPDQCNPQEEACCPPGRPEA